MTHSRLALFALAVSALAGAATAQPSPPPAAGDAKAGQQLYMTVGCYECHGTTGAGGSAGPRLGPNPLPMAAFVNQLRHPRRMPPYREPVMTEAQIGDIRAFLASVPASPSAAQIPLLR